MEVAVGDCVVDELEGVDDGAGEEELEDGLGSSLPPSFGFSSLLPFPLSPEPPLLPASKTTIVAWVPLGTVTTQKAAPPAPSVPLPVISLTLFLAGSISQGSPLHPSHSTLTPNFGLSSLKGVAVSR